jgi:hypothetical protein
MLTINEVAQNIHARKQMELEAREELKIQTEAAIEDMLDVSDELAYYALRLREVLEHMEKPLREMCELAEQDAVVSLNMAENITAEMRGVGDHFLDIIEATAETFGEYVAADEDDEEEDEDEGLDFLNVADSDETQEGQFVQDLLNTFIVSARQANAA